MSAGYVDVFASLGAKLKNPQWSFSARTPDGSIAVSCWIDFFVPRKEHGIPGVMRYRDTLSRVAHNTLGAQELRGFLEEASEVNTSFRLVVARPGDPGALNSGRSASNPDNRFHVRTDVVGSLISFDGDEFVIDFQQTLASSIETV